MEANTITVNGVEYVEKSAVNLATNPGKRAVLVLDRGWIVAGDIEDKDGRIIVTRAVHVRSWTEIGFDGMIANPKSNKVTITPVPNGFNCPSDAELFRVPVGDAWGL